ncbi:hypothetical protein SAMN05421638_0255 [Kaistella treverensis]|uniref:ATP-grasp domain-containing protein n=1 Tax=Kaistella treverensis TaxID=631455 RepID=A0A1I3JLK7_9FLAO|nr:hypothetical protein [Kaistella treverensis]SFI61159.1 hypothetical protein SAMN05421638_0255 [Kaistella treverensis]
MQTLFLKITSWERWDWRIKYVPILPVWVWNCLRARSFWFFTPSNPKLVFGGFEGATKTSIYEHLPPGSFPETLLVKKSTPFCEVEKAIDGKFKYPFIVKPDIGRMGFMFRIIHNRAQLLAYNGAMSVDYLIQEKVNYPLEVSVFYYRFPNKNCGTITGFVRKKYLQICGDGKSTVEQLMLANDRVSRRIQEMKIRHKDRLQMVLKDNETLCLSYALNLSKGCRLMSLEHEKDDALHQVFDEISSYSDSLFYGRFDIKCASVDDLKAGKNYSIIEYNGCGAEPHHVYGNGNSLLKACKILAEHWLILTQISRQNRTHGVKYDNFTQGWTTMINCRKHFAKLKKLDANFPEFH